MAIFETVAISQTGSTLLNAVQVNTTQGNVLNEVVSLGDGSTSNVASINAAGQLLVNQAGGSIAYSQVVLTSASGGTQIIGSRTTREALVIVVMPSSSQIAFLGDVNVNQVNGLPLLVGQSVSIPTTAAIYGISAGTTTSCAVAFMEIYS